MANDTPQKSYGLTGALYLSKSGWLLLHVPNAVGRGAFQALHEPGIELPTSDGGDYDAHISVMRPEELEQIGGASRVTERGKEFSYSLGHLREFEPSGWKEMEKCWALEVHSPDLEKLRKSYGLSAIPGDGKLKFHITVAVRRRGVLGANDITKAPGEPETPARTTAPTFKIHDKPGVFLIKASGDACPACGGTLTDLRGKLVCTHCHRICEGCCEGSVIRNVDKVVYKTLEKKGFLKEASFADAFYSLAEPEVRHWLQRNGMQLGEFFPHHNWDDVMESQRFTDFKNAAMKEAARHDSSPLKVLHGFSALFGGHWNQSALSDKTLMDGWAEVAPHLMRWSPEFWDQLHGETGSIASLTAAIADTHRYRGDMTSAEAAQRAKAIFDEMYSDPMKHRGFSAGQLGQIYREAGRRGWIGRDIDLNNAAEHLTPIVGVASAIRDTTANSDKPLTNIQDIFHQYDAVQARYKGRSPADIESYLRTGQELGRQGGLMQAALDRKGITLGHTGDPTLEDLNEKNETLLNNARNSLVGRMVAVTAHMKAEGHIRPNSPADEFLRSAQAGRITTADPAEWSQMINHSSDLDQTAAQMFLTNYTNNTQRHLTPELVAGIRASQGAIDVDPWFKTINQSTPGASAWTQGQQREQFVDQLGYDSSREYEMLQGAPAKQFGSIIGEARQRGQEAQQLSGIGQQGPVARTMEALKQPNPSLESVGKSFLNMHPLAMSSALPRAKIAALAADAHPVMQYIEQKYKPVYDTLDKGHDWSHVSAAREKAAVGPGFQGIRDRSDMGDLSKLTPNEVIDLIIQRHDARRAGLHRDLRIGDQDRGLYSWAMRAEGLPEKGRKVLANQQPLHEHAYGNFQGTLGPGYGQGTVRRERKSRILITQASPTKIEFTTADTGTPERFVLFKPDTFGAKQWLLMNTTPTEAPPADKPHMKSIRAEEVEPFIDSMQQGTTYQSKLDGARSLIKLMKGGVEVLSYRKSKRTEGPIMHTERVFGGRPKVDYPKNLEGSTLVGELTARDRTGKVAPPQTTGGLLNATIENSLKAQQAKGLRLQDTLFDAQSLGKKPVDYATTPYADRRKIIEQLLPYLPQDRFDMSQQVEGPEAGKQLWHDIIEGRHPDTHEGIVAYPPVGMPIKAKQMQDADVHITGTFPGAGKYSNRGVGGFEYALTPDGPVAGKVGTGLSDEMRAHAFAHPEEYIGRVARIHSQEQLPSGAYRAPAFLALHEDW